jgi:hypothetical protein
MAGKTKWNKTEDKTQANVGRGYSQHILIQKGI